MGKTWKKVDPPAVVSLRLEDDDVSEYTDAAGYEKADDDKVVVNRQATTAYEHHQAEPLYADAALINNDLVHEGDIELLNDLRPASTRGSSSPPQLELGFYYKAAPSPDHTPEDADGMLDTDVDLLDVTMQPRSSKRGFASPQSLTKKLGNMSLDERHLVLQGSGGIDASSIDPRRPRAPNPPSPGNYEAYLLSRFKVLLFPDYETLYDDATSSVIGARGLSRLPEWRHVFGLLLPPGPGASMAVPEGCPICLAETAVWPRITSCGHVFCLECIYSYLALPASVEERYQRTLTSWKKCPLCYNMIHKKDLKYLLYPTLQASSSLELQSAGLAFEPILDSMLGLLPPSLQDLPHLRHQYYLPTIQSDVLQPARVSCALLDTLYHDENMAILQLMQECLNGVDVERLAIISDLLAHLYANYDFYTRNKLRSFVLSQSSSTAFCPLSTEPYLQDVHGRAIFVQGKNVPEATKNTEATQLSPTSTFDAFHVEKGIIDTWPNVFNLSINTPYHILHPK